ncbi:MAG: polysaccharide biosynthesis C-terminal domain-containing protein [Bacteroidetes bacterium]|nr:polysaccharide biosynthesis C-terminal domain-containing protein [Bacteroidota bacterium]
MAIINFLVLIISAKYLGVVSRGEISILLLNIAIVQIVNEVYTGYSLVYFITKFNLVKIIKTGFVFTILVCTISNTVLFILGKQITNFILLSFICNILVVLNTFNCVIILAKEKIKLYNFLSFLQPLLLLLGLFIQTYIRQVGTFEAYIYPMLGSFIVAWIFSTYFVIVIFKNDDDKKEYESKAIFINGFYCQAANLLFILSNRFSYYLLDDNSQVGLYSSACSLAESLLLVNNAISPILLTRISNGGNNKENALLTLTLSKVSLVMCVIGYFIFWLLPESFYLKLFGGGFAGIKHYILVYAPAVLCIGFFGIISNYYSAVGKLIYNLRANFAGFILSIASMPFLIKNFGIEGAAISAFIAYFIVLCFSTMYFFKLNKINISAVFQLKNDIIRVKKLFLAK